MPNNVKSAKKTELTYDLIHYTAIKITKLINHVLLRPYGESQMQFVLIMIIAEYHTVLGK